MAVGFSLHLLWTINMQGTSRHGHVEVWHLVDVKISRACEAVTKGGDKCPCSHHAVSVVSPCYQVHFYTSALCHFFLLDSSVFQSASSPGSCPAADLNYWITRGANLIRSDQIMSLHFPSSQPLNGPSLFCLQARSKVRWSLARPHLLC